MRKVVSFHVPSPSHCVHVKRSYWYHDHPTLQNQGLSPCLLIEETEGPSYHGGTRKEEEVNSIGRQKKQKARATKGGPARKKKQTPLEKF
jgi:hypothetical protein